ncbi:hypothetical protein MNBD_GAMMA03-2074 [hydrothermal vent metagenome]|uniref:Glycosyltransferase 2-like domain-containing protein n=1 Tax=hydrothermal vent metagenome TaxID=652676 RepID=A0A3B0WC79_9ZZZZ
MKPTINFSPTISIVLPTHNGAQYLKQSIESCLKQTYPNIELVIVNDGSTDTTVEIINSFNDARIKYISLPTNKGIVAALNKGFSETTGEFLSWTSDDNCYTVNAFEVMLKTLENEENIDFVYANYHMIDVNGKVLKSGHVENPQGLDRDNYVGGCFLYRRKVYEIIGDFNAEAFLVEDYEYWLRVRAQFCMKKLDDFLYYYRMHGSSLTTAHGLEKIQDQVERIRAAYISPWKQDFLIGKRFFYKKDFSKSRTFLLKSLTMYPFYYQTWRLLIKGILRK